MNTLDHEHVSQADVVCIGGALIGSAAAYFLTEDPSFDGRVVVVEQDPSYARASSSLSGSSIREQFSEPVNIKASQFGMDFFDDFHRHVEVDGQSPELGFRGTGYLFLADRDGAPQLQRIHETQRANGGHAQLLPPADLAARFPFLDTDGIELASLGSEREGSLDAWALLSGFKQRAIANGATYLRDRVVAISTGNGRATQVSLASGRTVDCGHVINAAGTRAAEVAAMVDVEIPVEPRVRSIFVIDCRATIEGRFPLIITPEGVHVRREHQQFLCGVSPSMDPTAAHDDFAVRHDEFEELVWPALATRIPAFDRISVTSSWAGHYAVNTVDHNMIIGPVPGVENFLLANGFSGHGLQHSPAVGRALCELIVDGSYRTIDMGPLGYERFDSAVPRPETAII